MSSKQIECIFLCLCSGVMKCAPKHPVMKYRPPSLSHKLIQITLNKNIDKPLRMS